MKHSFHQSTLERGTRIFTFMLCLTVPASLAFALGRVAEQLAQHERCEALYKAIETDTDTYVYDATCKGTPGFRGGESGY